MAYEDYRIAPTQAANPWVTRGSPQQFYAPSSSIWGNITKSHGLGPIKGVWDTAKDAPKRLLTAQGWGDIGSFGVTRHRREQRDAKAARRSAVAAWRRSEGTRLGDSLGQYGADVRGDLSAEMQAALGAGGEMGDQNAIQDAMAKFQQRTQQYLLGRSRAAQARKVDAMMADPTRLADRQARLTAERKQGLSTIAEQYKIGARNNAFNQARRGMQGGSTDIEQQGQLGRERDATTMGLQSGLDAKAQQYRMGDQQQRAALMGLIYADDPNTAAAYQRTLEGIGEQGKLIQEQSALSSQRAALNSATSQGISQALGGAMSAAAPAVGYYAEHRGTGA